MSIIMLLVWVGARDAVILTNHPGVHWHLLRVVQKLIQIRNDLPEHKYEWSVIEWVHPTGEGILQPQPC
jgi:hypothetical protein